LVKIEDRAGGLRLTFKKDSGTKIVTASRVICTLPFSTLREVEGVDSLPLTRVKKRCIRELAYGVNSKHMLAYKTGFWRESREPNSCKGYLFTDLPAQVLWDSSRAQRGSEGILTCFRGGRANALAGAKHVPGLLNDLEQMYPGSRALYQSRQASMRWQVQPFAKGSYACAAPGQNTTIIGAAQSTELGGRLLFAGEHASQSYQGFMNGSIETALTAVNSILGRATAPLLEAKSRADAL
jgi:monoamine oxidase